MSKAASIGALIAMGIGAAAVGILKAVDHLNEWMRHEARPTGG